MKSQLGWEPIASNSTDGSDLFSSQRNPKNISRYSVRVLGSNILPSKSVKNLGISLDRNLTMSTQISKTKQMCFTSASNKIRQGMSDIGILENICVSLIVKLYLLWQHGFIQFTQGSNPEYLIHNQYKSQTHYRSEEI